MISCAVDKQKPVVVVAPLVCSIFDTSVNLFFRGFNVIGIAGFVLFDKHPKELFGSLVASAALSKGMETEHPTIFQLFNDVDRMMFDLHVIP